jgi:hypothetical protein
MGSLINIVKRLFRVKLVKIMHPCLKNDHKIIEGSVVNTTPGDVFTTLHFLLYLRFWDNKVCYYITIGWLKRLARY